jgi:hypothetical protein
MRSHRRPSQRVLLVEQKASPVAPASSSDATRQWVESLLTLASLTYGLGFLTVYVHTGQLGLPVLTLLEPVYVLVGLPLTLAGLLVTRIWRWLRREIGNNIDRVRQAMQQYRDPRVPQNQDVYTDFWNLYTAVMGAVTFILPAPTEWLIQLIIKPYEQQARQLMLQDARARELAGQLLQRLNALAAGVRHGVRLFGISLLVVGLIATVAAYIFWLYPRIPQSWGGGQVQQVQLLMAANKIPPMLASPLKASSEGAQASQLVTVKLLYNTGEFYFVEADNGARVALAKDLVNGVVWVASGSTQ